MSAESSGVYLALTEKNKIAITTRKNGDELRFAVDPENAQTLISELQRLRHKATRGDSQ